MLGPPQYFVRIASSRHDLSRPAQARSHEPGDFNGSLRREDLGDVRFVPLIPGKAEIQAKDVPIEVFFKKIVAIRDRLRVLEQKVNAHATLAAEEKLELQGYITRCYGSLTTFNVLFASEGGRIQGESTG